MVKQKIAIIGVGHISHALLSGWFHAKAVKANNIILSDHEKKNLTEMQKRYGAKIASNNREAVENASIVFIAVRPRDVRTVIQEIKDYLKENTIIVSIAACVTMDLYKQYLGKEKKLVRIMPNIPIAYNQGVIGWIANQKFSKIEKETIKALLSPLGYVIECKDEEMINKVSMISGSGPGYVAYFFQQLEKQARMYGFSEEQAKMMAHNTFTGTLTHMQEMNIKAEDLVSAVATRGGITEEVIRTLNEKEFPEIFSQSLENGLSKIHNISDELKE